MEEHIEDTKVPRVIVAFTTCLTLAYLVVCLRFVSRRIGNVKLAANDWLIVIALVNALVMKFAGSIVNTITGFLHGFFCWFSHDNSIRWGKARDLGHGSKGLGYSMYRINREFDCHGNA